MKTAVTEKLGIQFPILAFSHCRDVVVEVSKAGGMGVLGAIGFRPEQLEIELDWIEKHIEGKPYGVDILLPVSEGEAPPEGATPREIFPAEHVNFALRLLAEHGIEATAEEIWKSTPLAQKGDTLWNDRSNNLLDVAFRHRIGLIASALGSPSEKMMELARKQGVPTAALAGKIEHARRSVARGVDFIVAQGTEAGGHTGDIATMVLVPEIVDAIAPVPVIAAGGIGRGRQVAASLALGAHGVWCGSVWLTTQEAETEPAVKERFLAATSSDTIRSRYRTGKPARQLRSTWTDAWERPDAPPPLKTPFQGFFAEPALARVARAAIEPNSPARPMATFFVGQIVGSLNQVTSTKQVVYEMINEYIETIDRLASLTND